MRDKRFKDNVQVFSIVTGTTPDVATYWYSRRPGSFVDVQIRYSGAVFLNILHPIQDNTGNIQQSVRKQAENA